MTEVSNNKRIAKNTMYLYIRMAITMFVQLYTSRVVLQTLGVADYGIYSIVGAIVVSLSFITNPLSVATQRFLSFELGRKNTGRIKDIFSMSLIVYVILSLVILFLAETVGLWFLNHKMEIPSDRLYAANWVFQCSVLAFIIRILNVPFDSAIIAYERMSFYAYVSVFEVISKLAIVYLLLLFAGDKLILYGILVTVVMLLVTTTYKIYCNRYLRDIKIYYVKDKQLLKQLLSFSGWSLFGSVANISAEQGLNLLLNLFFGVTVNAAMGIANQVSAAVNQFVYNFQTAFKPQIIKSYAKQDLTYLYELICKTSKFSFLLLFMIVCPIWLNIDFILHFWLGNDVPQYTTIFCRLILIFALIEAMAAPFYLTISATGNIKKYQQYISLLLLLNIIVSYMILRQGYLPQTVLYVKCCISILCLLIRLCFVKKMIRFSPKIFWQKAVMPIIVITFIDCLFLSGFYLFDITNRFVVFALSFIILGIVHLVSVYYFALDAEEKKKISHYFQLILQKNNLC